MKSKYDIAKRKVKKRVEFRSHLVSYIVICSFLFGINLLTSAGPDHLWAIWPALGWGLGVVFHGLEAYGLIADKADEEELIEKEMRRIEQKEAMKYDDYDEPLELPEIEKKPRYTDEDYV